MIKASVIDIKSADGVSFYKFAPILDDKSAIYMLALSPLDEVKIGSKVGLNFKSSDLIISTKKLENCSISSQLACKIIYLNLGSVTCVVGLNFNGYEFESIISANSAKRLNLSVGDDVFACVKSTSVYIAEILES